jgi:hypothetical protein
MTTTQCTVILAILQDIGERQENMYTGPAGNPGLPGLVLQDPVADFLILEG